MSLSRIDGRKRGSGTDVVIYETPEKRRAVERSLVQRANKTSLVEALHLLHGQGLLDKSIDLTSKSSTRRALQRAAEEHSKVETPYGPVIQQMHLGIPNLEYLDYANPFALLSYMCSLSADFMSIMATSLSNNIGNIVIYIDEVCPGNPLRTGLSRQLQCVYWCFADWPQWLLQRTAAWPCFCVVKSKALEKLPGATSELMRRILHIFFAEHGASFVRGIVLRNADTSIMITARFKGFLADLAAHKYLYFCKGSSGRMPCLSCRNITRLLSPAQRAAMNVLDVSCPHYADLKFHTDASFYTIVDGLAEAATHMGKKQFETLEKDLGVIHSEHNLFHDKYLRTILNPLNNCLRDWMHCLVGNGMANTHVAYAMHTLKDHGVTSTLVSEYAEKFHMPRKLNKVKGEWFSDAHVKEDTVHLFAGEILGMVAILHCFFVDNIAPRGELLEHCQCLGYLRLILGLFQLGAEKSMGYIAKLRELIDRHHTLYQRLYPAKAVKPKYHHLLHIADNMVWVGRLLSCFVTERKHRTTKNAAMHVFRHMEHTVMADLTNRHIENLKNIYSQTLLLDSRAVNVYGSEFTTSVGAHLLCGDVRASDIVIVTSGVVGRVVRFWHKSGTEPVAHLDTFHKLNGEEYWSMNAPIAQFVKTDDIVDALPWAYHRESDGIIRVVLPFLFLNR